MSLRSQVATHSMGMNPAVAQPLDTIMATSGSPDAGHSCGLWWVMNGNTYRSCSGTMDPDMALGSSLDLTITLAPGGKKDIHIGLFPTTLTSSGLSLSTDMSHSASLSHFSVTYLSLIMGPTCLAMSSCLESAWTELHRGRNGGEEHRCLLPSLCGFLIARVISSKERKMYGFEMILLKESNLAYLMRNLFHLHDRPLKM